MKNSSTLCFEKTPFEDFRDHIYDLFTDLRWANGAEIYFGTHKHFDTLYKARHLQRPSEPLSRQVYEQCLYRWRV